jgi:hypothetical protein
LAQFTQGIDRPIAGIDPGSLADIYVSDINMANQIASGNAGNQAASAQRRNEGLGAGLGAFGKALPDILKLFNKSGSSNTGPWVL